MEKDEARVVYAMLVAAFPGAFGLEAASESVWVGVFAKLPDPARLAAAVELVIEHSERWPSIALVRKTYFSDALRERFAPRALEEPDVTPEQRAENLRQITELRRRFWPRSVTEPSA